LVEQLAEQHIPTHSIWRTIMKNSPGKKVIPKDIHNAVQKIHAAKMVGESTMQQLESVLNEKNFTYFTRENETTEAVEDIFFVHKHSFTMWCAFPHVLMIDATYKTNMYNLPLVQVVGMTSTNQSFAVAHAVISAERVDNYVWLLEMIKSMLRDCMEPRVIITDRELALMNACDLVFPSAHKYLCRFHIAQNINRNSKKKFNGKQWKEFSRSWTTLCESATEEIYEYNLSNFEGNLRDIGRTRKFCST
jgi:histone-lysine N-methyltransferase SETD2